MEYLADGASTVVVSIPSGQAARARAFYRGVLGFREVGSAFTGSDRHGVWLRSGALLLHLRETSPFRAGRRVSVSFAVADLQALMSAVLDAGRKPHLVAPVNEVTRFYLDDPFGTRLEFVQARHRAAGAASVQSRRSPPGLTS